MTVSEWIGQLSLFGIKPGMERMRSLLDHLGHPEQSMQFVHVAGTNGKGTTAVLIAQALQSQGLVVGLTTSPDLGRIQERIVINGQPIADDVWEDVGQRVRRATSSLSESATSFEILIAMALVAFQQQGVQWAVVEVGMGGRLDATNVIPCPALSVITPVAYDHMQYLGDRIEQIAGEKAGILKQGTRLILAKQPFSEGRQVILEYAERLGIPIVEPQVYGRTDDLGAVLSVPGLSPIHVPLHGSFQADNVATAWTAVEVLKTLGVVHSLSLVAESWAHVKWPGRFQVVHHRPLWVVDGAHNPHGVSAVVETLRQPPWNQYRWYLVFGVLADKAAVEMFEALWPHMQGGSLTRVPGVRGLDPTSIVQQLGLDGRWSVQDDPEVAVQGWLSRLQDDRHAALLTTGSLALIAHLNRASIVDRLLATRH